MERIRVLHVEEEHAQADKVQGIDKRQRFRARTRQMFDFFSVRDSNTPSIDEGGTAADDRRGQRVRDEGREANFVINPTEGRDDSRGMDFQVKKGEERDENKGGRSAGRWREEWGGRTEGKMDGSRSAGETCGRDGRM